MHGFVVELEPTQTPRAEAIAIYASGEDWTHFAKFTNGVWTSKIGEDHDIAHASLELLPERFVRRRIEEGPCLLLLDGLDEAPSEAARETVARLVERAARAWTNCRFVVTTRPQAYRDESVLSSFDEARIGALDAGAVRVFLARWSAALYPESPRKAEEHAAGLIQAIEAKPEIWRMARNPVMLTAVAVLHWNEKRMPEQRADLYESILGWLAKSRERRPGRPNPERCLALLQEVAWEMQVRPGGRLVQVEREWAVGVLAARFREGSSEGDKLERARRFLAEEEVDSGIVVRRGKDVRFWHLTFQEHLAARALAALGEPERHRLLFAEGKAYSSEWREVVLLLAGLLHRAREEKADVLVSAALDALYRGAGWRGVWQWLGAPPPLRERARSAVLLGAILRDLQPLAYRPSDPRWEAVVRSVVDIFDARRSAEIPFKARLEVAEALGQAGDPRLKEDNWVTVPSGSFLMGAQSEDRHKSNYDPGSFEDEGPVREVRLEAFQIGRYPVTVVEYRRFVEAGATGRSGGGRTAASARRQNRRVGTSNSCTRTGPWFGWTGTKRRRIARGRADGCPRRRSGNGRRGGARDASTHGETRPLTRVGQTMTKPRLERRRRWVCSHAGQRQKGFMTWRGMCGSGWRTGMKRDRSDPSGGARSSTYRGTSGRRAVTGACPATGTSSSGFVAPGKCFRRETFRLNNRGHE